MKYCPFCMSELSDNTQNCPKCGRNINDYQHPAHVLNQGAMLHDRYLIGGVLGEGGFGITYIGMDTLLQYRVAIKEFFPNGMVNRNNTVSNDVMSISTETAKEVFSKSRDNFLREARTLAKFSNEPGIVAVKDFFEENHTVYIVMEYLDGITLKQYLNQVGTISPNNTVCLLMPVFRSLKKIHEKKLIHRDISPDNIMLVGEEVKLLDFGAAREFADEKSLSVMLKHGYAPMEQYRRHGIQGTWTDVYAICATMYKCITGKIPPDAPDRVFEDDIKMPSELGIDIDPDFEKVLKHGLALKPDERIQSIDELLEEIDKIPGMSINEEKEVKTVTVSPEPDVKTVIPDKEPDDAVRLSQLVPDSEMADNKPSIQPAPEIITQKETESVRYSEYIPSSKEKDPEKVPAPETSDAPEIDLGKPSDTSDDKKNNSNKNKFIIIGAVAAVAVIGAAIGIGAAVSNKPVDVEESSSAVSEVTESSAVSEVTESSAVSEETSKESAVSSTPSKPESSAESSKPAESSSAPAADLESKKNAAIIEMRNSTYGKNYRAAQLEEIEAVIEKYSKRINNATAVAEIEYHKKEGVSKLMEIKTDEELSNEEAAASKVESSKPVENLKPTVIDITSVVLNKTNLTLTVGETYKLSATVSPSNATNKSVTWTTSDKTVASVDSNGNVKALKAGNVTVIATSNNSITAKCQITVKEENKQSEEFNYADMGNYVYFKNDILHVDNSLFGKSRSSIEKLFSPGTIYKTVKGPDDFGEAQGATFLSIPFKSPKNKNGNMETIDFIFIADKLEKIRYATKSSYDYNIENKVRAEYGEERFVNSLEPESMELIWVMDKNHFFTLCTDYYGSDLVFIQDYSYIDYEWQ